MVHRPGRDAERLLPAVHAVPVHRDGVGDADDARRVRRRADGAGGEPADGGARRSDRERHARQPRGRSRRLGERLPRGARGERDAAAGGPGAADPQQSQGREPDGDARERDPRRRPRQADHGLAHADRVLRAAAQAGTATRRTRSRRSSASTIASRSCATRATSRCRRPRRSPTSTSGSRTRRTSSRSTSSRRSRQTQPTRRSIRSSRRSRRATRSPLSTCRRSSRSPRRRAARRSPGRPGTASGSSCRSTCALPYTVGFANPTDATTAANEVRVSTVLDSDLDVRSFRLGDIKVGSVTINVPADRAAFQGDFDLRNSLGFVVRVSAGVDPTTRIATWLLQAIDPETGEVLHDATHGLLLPNNAQGRGAGFVSWTIEASSAAADGAELTAQARVQLDNQAPFETPTATSTLDASAPTTTLTAAPAGPGSADYVVTWQPVDEPGGSGVRHTSVYVRVDGGPWTIWQRQTTATQAVYEGQARPHLHVRGALRRQRRQPRGAARQRRPERRHRRRRRRHPAGRPDDARRRARRRRRATPPRRTSCSCRRRRTCRPQSRRSRRTSPRSSRRSPASSSRPGSARASRGSGRSPCSSGRTARS